MLCTKNSFFYLGSSLGKKLQEKVILGNGRVLAALFFQYQVTGVSGPSGLPAPGHAGQSLSPATEAVAALNPRPEERPALENRKYTMELEFKSRDNPVLLLLSVQVGLAETFK